MEQVLKEYTRCNKCGCTYEDEESIELVKFWLSSPDRYSPCPNIGCSGQMEVKEDNSL